MAVYLDDNFNRANSGTVGAPAVGPTPTEGASGASSGGNWDISNNAVVPGGAITENIIWWNVGVTSFRLTAVVKTLAGSKEAGIVFRGNGAGAFWMIAAFGGGNYEVYKNNGGFVLLGSPGIVAAASDVLVLDVTPSAVTIKLNGTQIFTSTDTTLNGNTQVGFRAYNTGIEWDSIYVEDIPSPPRKRFTPARQRQAVIRSAHL